MSLHDLHMARRTLLASGLAVTAVGAAGIPASAQRATAAPSISSTSDWEARDPSSSVDVLDSKPNKIIVHHTATPNSDDTSQSHAFALCRSIQNYHMDSNGWLDTGQNFTNSRGGHLMEGRHKSLNALEGGSQHVLGAHAGEQNSVALGIENEGTYTDASVPSALWNALVQLCSYMVSQYGLDASAIYGHRDYMSTACPGDVLYQRLPELRTEIALAAAQPEPTTPAVWPLLTPQARGPRVTAAQLLFRSHGAQVPVNGVFDVDTQRAAQAFLGAHSPHRVECSATRTPERDLFGGTAWVSLAPVLSERATGDAVRATQVLLTSRGHHASSEDGFGARTVDAVRRFQAAQSLPTTGVVDHPTWQRLLG